MKRQLIFDIGANNGDDTRFYLAKGFRVVAVEADPALCAAMTREFATEIATGALVIENVGVADAVGTLDFFVNSYSEWSSFLKNSKATMENTFEKLTVNTIPLSDLIARHGASHYLKIDIEGFEKQALATLRADMALPEYLSFEINLDCMEIIENMVALGYRDFCVVRQGCDFLPKPPKPALEGHYVRQKFLNSMSGCFGRELREVWVPSSQFKDVVADALAAKHARKQRGERPGWHDIHCRLGALG
jgi:FkbM family methyltransferase